MTKIQSNQKVSVHLMITIQKAGAQRLFDHPVIYGKKFVFLSFAENEGLYNLSFLSLLPFCLFSQVLMLVRQR